LRGARIEQVEQPIAAPPTDAAEIKSSFENTAVRRFIDPREGQGLGHALAAARQEFARVWPALIDGKHVDTGDYLRSINPTQTTEVVGRVAMVDADQVSTAIAAAKRAFPGWAACSAAQRAEFLRCAAAALSARRDEFAAWEIYEAGKNWAEADANVAEAIDYLNYYAAEALRLAEPRQTRVPGEDNFYAYRPRGVGVVIPPWNFPLAILTGMLAAALVTGNAVIVKPSSQTPAIAARFISLLQLLGFPPGVIQFVPGRGAVIGDLIVSHPDLSFISFTGSEEIGTRILRLAAAVQPGQRHIKHVIAEMGGKNAIIVDSDADLDDAVLGVVHSAFGYQGQKCSACSRVIVVGSSYERFLRRLVEATRSLVMGMPEDPAAFLGPVIEPAAQTRILRAIEEGRHYARLVYQGDCSGLNTGCFVGPAIFSDVPADSPLAQQEIFGPVLAVLRAEQLEHAIRLANDSAYALTGGLYSRSPSNIERVKRNLEVGNLYINRRITGALVSRQPFGGFKLSGLGSKAGGPDYLLQFILPRTVTENTLRRGFAPDT
jgi:RHH-type proline utilization regulon transcriptional repressor/proline dehydrogenase/delta 1-pyrroline-5-carboxylate dehydrogenase